MTAFTYRAWDQALFSFTVSSSHPHVGGDASAAMARPAQIPSSQMQDNKAHAENPSLVIHLRHSD
jgi:hypothetical protein